MNSILFNNCYGGFGYSQLAAQWFKEKLSLDIPYGDSFEYEVKDYMEENYPRHHQIYKDCALALGNGNEEEGLERMSGEYSSLEFHEIDDNEYYITEYDGLEDVITTKDLIFIEDDEKEHYVLHAESYCGIDYSPQAMSWLSGYIFRNVDDFKDKIKDDLTFYSDESYINYYFPRHHKAFRECVLSLGNGDEEVGKEIFGNNLVLEKITDDNYYIMSDDGMEYLIFRKWFTKIS